MSQRFPDSSSRPVAAGKFITLRGQKIYIKGVTYGPFGAGPDGCEHHDIKSGDQDFAAMAAYGINAVRTDTLPPHWLLECTQKHGLRLLARIFHTLSSRDAARAGLARRPTRFLAGLYEYILPGEESKANAARPACSKSQQKGYEISGLAGLAWEQHVDFLEDSDRPQAILQRVREQVRWNGEAGQAGLRVNRGGNFDRWDLEVSSGRRCSIRLQTLIKEHGSGKRLARIRVWPRWEWPSAVVAAGAATLAAIAALDGALFAAGVLGALAIAALTAGAATAATSMAAVLHAIDGLKSPFPHPPTQVGSPVHSVPVTLGNR